MNEQDDTSLLQKKADAFYILKKVVHITLKNDRWKRGVIQEVRADFIMLEERLEGLIPVFFVEIAQIEGYKEREA